MDVNKIRKDFPVLNRKVNGRPLIYFDNAATSQTPKQVINTIVDYYENYNANIHRGVHALSQEATNAYEGARQKIQYHFNAAHPYEMIFTSGTTHAINIVSSGYTELLNQGDELIVSALEHHSNIVPWQMLCKKTGALLKVIPMNEDGDLIMDAYDELLSDRTKLVFVNHVSNALGTVNPIEEIINKAHAVGAEVLIDGAQASPHIKIDLQALNVDYYVTSAHKICGPTGIGILYGKETSLKRLPPYQGGGEMIAEVTFEKTTYADLPHKFEAGTPNFVQAVGLSAAIDYLNNIGMTKIARHEKELTNYALEKMSQIEGLRVFGSPKNRAGVISFNIDGIHAHDLAQFLNEDNIAIRVGHHCAQPLLSSLKENSVARLSIYIYNDGIMLYIRTAVISVGEYLQVVFNSF